MGRSSIATRFLAAGCVALIATVSTVPTAQSATAPLTLGRAPGPAAAPSVRAARPFAGGGPARRARSLGAGYGYGGLGYRYGGLGFGTTGLFGVGPDLSYPAPLPLSVPQSPLPPRPVVYLAPPPPPRCPLIIKVGRGLRHVPTRVVYGHPGCV